MIRQSGRVKRQSRIPDNQCCICAFEHDRKIRRQRKDSRTASVAVGEYGSRQHHRCARARVRRERANASRLYFRDQQDAAHGSAAGNADRWYKLEPDPVQFGAGNQTDIRRSFRQPVRALCGDGEAEVEDPLLRTVHHAPDQRHSVQVADSANPQLIVNGSRTGTQLCSVAPECLFAAGFCSMLPSEMGRWLDLYKL